MKVVLEFLFLLGLFSFTTIFSQDITNKLGGNTSTEKLTVTDSNDNIKFVVQADGKVGINKSTADEALDVNGNINISDNLVMVNRPAFSSNLEISKGYEGTGIFMGTRTSGQSHLCNIGSHYNNENGDLPPLSVPLLYIVYDLKH